MRMRMVLFPLKNTFRRQNGPNIPPFIFSCSFILFQDITLGDLPSTPRHLKSKFRRMVGGQAFPDGPGCAALWLCHWLAWCVTLDKGFGLSQASASSCIKEGRVISYSLCRNVRITNEIAYMKHLLQCTVHSRSSKNGKYNYLPLFIVLGDLDVHSHQKALIHH